jgi:hypothetical protein
MSMGNAYNVVIVEAGRGGALAATALRSRVSRLNCDCRQEAKIPYERLPFSKAIFPDRRAFLIRPQSF